MLLTAPPPHVLKAISGAALILGGALFPSLLFSSFRTGDAAAVTRCRREQPVEGVLFPKTCSCVTGFSYLSAQDICGFDFISGRCLFRPAGSYCMFLTQSSLRNAKKLLITLGRAGEVNQAPPCW